MARVKQVTSGAAKKSSANTTRLPLALKSSNSITSSTTLVANATLPHTIGNIDMNPISSLTSQTSSSPATQKHVASSSTPRLSKETVSLPDTIRSETRLKKIKKSKSISKTQVIKYQHSDEDSDEEAQYDLTTCINESGGIDKFLATPCMILYKCNLTNQVDLENYVLEHLTMYSKNPCLFAGVKGTDTVKHKINQFYQGNRKKSMTSTILFKANTSKTTTTQQVLLKNGKLFLYVDEVMRNKTFKNKKKRVRIDATNVQHHASGTTNDITIELAKGYVGKRKQVFDEDDSVNEETSQINVSTENMAREQINWKGGSKNCGLYMLLTKKQEVKECVNNVLSYGREHGVLLSGVQLKTLLDIENVEITKERANSIVQLISAAVQIVSNPHFIPPTAQKPVFEYYGDDFELGLVCPTKYIPIPKTIFNKFNEKKSKKQKKIVCDEKSEDEAEASTEITHRHYSQACNSGDDNDTTEVNDRKLHKVGDTTSVDDSEGEKEESKQLNSNHSEEDDNNNSDVQDDGDKKINPLVDRDALSEESINGFISPSLTHLKETAINDKDNGVDSDNEIIVSKDLQAPVANFVGNYCMSPGTGKTDSSITINAKNRSSSTVSSNSMTSAVNQAILTDALHSPPPHPSNTIEITTELSPLQQHVTLSQPNEENSSGKIFPTRQRTSKEYGYKRRSFGLRSKTKKKRQSSIIFRPTMRKQDDRARTVPSIAASTKKKLNNDGKNTANYQALTKTLRKIPKKPAAPLATTAPDNNEEK